MMYMAILPGQCLSIIHNKAHSYHYLDYTFSISLFKRYQYIKANTAIIDNGKTFEIGRWAGILDAMNWPYDIINSDDWMNYFGLWPDDPKQMEQHWINVVKYRYPMLPVKPDNYEPILAACYLHDRAENEAVGAFV